MLRYLIAALATTLAFSSCAPAQSQSFAQPDGLVRQPLPLPIFSKGDRWLVTFTPTENASGSWRKEVVLSQPRQQGDDVTFENQDDAAYSMGYDVSQKLVNAKFIDGNKRIIMCGFAYTPSLINDKIILGKQIDIPIVNYMIQGFDPTKGIKNFDNSSVQCKIELLKKSPENDLFVLNEVKPRKNPSRDELPIDKQKNVPNKGDVYESEGIDPITKEIINIKLTLDNFYWGGEQYIFDDVKSGKMGYNWSSFAYDSYLELTEISSLRRLDDRLKGLFTFCSVERYKNEVGVLQHGRYFVGKLSDFNDFEERRDFSKFGECWIKKIQ